MKLDTYDRGTVEWRPVVTLDGGTQVQDPIEYAVTRDAPTDADWYAEVKRDGVSGVLIDTTDLEPGTYAIRSRWSNGDDRPQLIAGRIVVA